MPRMVFILSCRMTVIISPWTESITESAIILSKPVTEGRLMKPQESRKENCIIKTAGKITQFISMQARQESLRFTMILWQDINWTAEETERTGCNEFS